MYVILTKVLDGTHRNGFMALGFVCLVLVGWCRLCLSEGKCRQKEVFALLAPGEAQYALLDDDHKLRQTDRGGTV